MDASDRLIERLQDSALYDHPVTGFELIETHISWVLLTGPKAYKLKKPLRFPFLDFSSLERRREACQDELRLNRRFAPGIYESVLPVIEDRDGRLRLGGEGRVIEYLLRMRQFEQSDMLDALADLGELGAPMVDELAEVLAQAHDRAPRLAGADKAPRGRAEEVRGWVDENFETLAPLLDRDGDRRRLARLSEWTKSEQSCVAPTIDARRAAGLVRECHGDLHLGNIVRFEGRPTPFDCIEFNPALRWLDPMNDLAFLMMDLRDRGLLGLAWRLANRYLQRCGDYDGLAVLRYYGVYRALVRAKVAALRLEQTEGERSEAGPSPDPDSTSEAAADATSEAAAVRAELAGHLRLAEAIADDHRPLLLLTHGLSGSGKSHLAAGLVEPLGDLQIRSDLERKRLHGLSPEDREGPGLDSGIYSARASQQTYDRLLDCARVALEAGYPVIADATFLRRADRRRFLDLARSLDAPCRILDLQAPRELLETRIVERAAAGRDASDADLAVLHRQLETREPLDADERALASSIDSGRPDVVEPALVVLRAAIPDLDLLDRGPRRLLPSALSRR